MLLFLSYISLSLLGLCSTENTTTEEMINITKSVTQTVYGFLDFTTTIGNTVMVFSPYSDIATSAKLNYSTVTIKERSQTESNTIEIQPSKAGTPCSFNLKDSNSDSSTSSSLETESEAVSLKENTLSSNNVSHESIPISSKVKHIHLHISESGSTSAAPLCDEFSSLTRQAVSEPLAVTTQQTSTENLQILVNFASSTSDKPQDKFYPPAHPASPLVISPENNRLDNSSFLTTTTTALTISNSISAPPTGAVSKSLAISEKNTTTTNTKPTEVEPKSLTISTSSTQSVLEDQPKFVKAKIITETSSTTQLASTKKYISMKIKPKFHRTTKPTTKPKTDKLYKPNTVASNNTPDKYKSSLKTEPSKIITIKNTNKPTALSTTSTKPVNVSSKLGDKKGPIIISVAQIPLLIKAVKASPFNTSKQNTKEPEIIQAQTSFTSFTNPKISPDNIDNQQLKESEITEAETLTANAVEISPSNANNQMTQGPEIIEVQNPFLSTEANRKSNNKKLESASGEILDVTDIIAAQTSSAPIVIEIKPLNVVEILANDSKLNESEMPQVQTSNITSVVVARPFSEKNTPTISAEVMDEKQTTSATTEGSEFFSSSSNSSPEYDYFSRQPSEEVDESFKVIDLESNSARYNKSEPSNSTYGATPPGNIYDETKPLEDIPNATYLTGKDHTLSLQNSKKIYPSSTIRILKTVAPTTKAGSNRFPVHETPPPVDEDRNHGILGNKISMKRLYTSNHFKNKFTSNKYKLKDDAQDNYGTIASEEEYILDTEYTASGPMITSPAYQSSTSNESGTTKKYNHDGAPLQILNRFGRPTTHEVGSASAFSEDQPSVTLSYTTLSRRFSPNSRRTSTRPEKSYSNMKQNLNPRIDVANPENNNVNNPPGTPVTYKFKMVRPRGRWQYKTTLKPRVTIRHQNENVDSGSGMSIELQGSNPDTYPILQHENDSSAHEVSSLLIAKTLRIDISTPADFNGVYYEVATIKSPFSFQVGSVKNTRFITITSTFERSLVRPTESPKLKSLSENILRKYNAYDEDPPLDSSITTLPPIALAANSVTPPLETITESFSTSQLMLKTHILPVVRGESDTSKYTLVQSYFITRLVTATKTLPPTDVYQFRPSKTLNEFNTQLDEAGSEVHLQLDFGDNNEQYYGSRQNVAKALLSDLDLTNIGSDFNIADVDNNRIIEHHLRTKKTNHKSTTTLQTTTPVHSSEQLKQLALLHFLNPNAALTNLITSSKPIIKTETLWDTHVLPLFNGGNTFFTTISRPTATLTKTEYEYMTSTLPMLQTSVLNQLLPQSSYQMLTTSVVTETLITQTESKILKLNFGAKTSFTTLFSTKVTPTVVTEYLTNSIPIQPTVTPWSNFFNPAPFAFNVPFPFLG